MKELIGKDCFNILDNKEYIFFYFGAKWCKPCQEILPQLEKLEGELNEKMIQFFKVDIDHKENSPICNKCKIKVVPSFLIFKDRNFLDRRKGNNINNIRQMIMNQLFPTVNQRSNEGILDKSLYPVDQDHKNTPSIQNASELFNKKNII